jgi:hypothetical protein
MRKPLDQKIVEQNRQCAICQVVFTNYSDIVPDHKDPRGMGGSRRDDHPENIQAVHWLRTKAACCIAMITWIAAGPSSYPGWNGI